MKETYETVASPFLATEKSLSKTTGIDILHPIRVFTLEGMGVDKNALLDLLSANVENLKPDEYDFRKTQLLFLKATLPHEQAYIDKIDSDYYLGNGKADVLQPLIAQLSTIQLEEFNKLFPHRKRAICQFELTKNGGDWSIERIYDNGFTQDVEDYRLEARVFHQTDEKITQNADFRSFLKALAKLTAEFKPQARKLKMVAHEMSVVTTRTTPGNNSPEGIHQDGSEFIVSAMVIERKGVLEGSSHIYGPDKQTKYLDYVLQPGEGVFQADKGTDMWHRVTAFHLDPQSNLEYGERNILGFDIDVIA